MPTPDAVPGRARIVYLLLLCGETAAASVIFWVSFPVFQAIVHRAGQPQTLDVSFEVTVTSAAVLLQVCYWIRYWRVPIWAPLRNPVAGHLLLFAGRASFFFGSALFSAIVFRHIPQLDAVPPLGQGAAKAAGFLFVLFALFCYALEVERLGRAIEGDLARP